MKLSNKILEAINRGIKFALDDFDDQEEIQGQVSSKVSHEHGTKEWLDLMREVVDLGLPSGTLWCKCNLGATCEPNNNKSWLGNYYAWGELEPNKKKYDWEHYKFYDGPDRKTVKIDIEPKYYINKYGIDNKLEVLQLEDDAAYQFKKYHNFKFHIPTKEQAQELIDNTKIIYIGISKINGNYIFFPETGIKEGSRMSLNRIDSGIWTSHVADDSFASKAECAWAINLYPTFNRKKFSTFLYGFWKCEGLPIRPVINL